MRARVCVNTPLCLQTFRKVTYIHNYKVNHQLINEQNKSTWNIMRCWKHVSTFSCINFANTQTIPKPHSLMTVQIKIFYHRFPIVLPRIMFPHHLHCCSIFCVLHLSINKVQSVFFQIFASPSLLLCIFYSLRISY